jgi:phosphoribosylanthranilate isomerase
MLKSAKTRVKICGITNLADAQAAVRFGADAVGFVFAKSPRQITVRRAREISAKIGPFVPRVGVFVNETLSRVASIMEEAMLDVAQLHGIETPEYAAKLAPYRVIKVFRVGEKFAVSSLGRYAVDAHMLETDARVAGGSGQTWDWRRLTAARFKTPIIVTGGLNPDNVQKAIRTLKPYAVDVSSGVEKRPGIKDHNLMEKFIRHAKTA